MGSKSACSRVFLDRVTLELSRTIPLLTVPFGIIVQRIIVLLDMLICRFVLLTMGSTKFGANYTYERNAILN